MTFLDQWVDMKLGTKVTGKWSLAAEQTAALARLEYDVQLAAKVGAWPRRLGGDASDEELALDKRRARRVEHYGRQEHRLWSGALNDKEIEVEIGGADEVREAGMLDWELWWADRQVELLGRRRVAATAGWRTRDKDGRKEANKACSRLSSELKWYGAAVIGSVRPATR